MVIITTVGTSLLKNRNQSDAVKCFGELGTTESRKISAGSLYKSTPDLDNKVVRFIKGDAANKNKTYKEIYKINDQYQLNLNASAEIKSICKIANGQPAKVYLLCTDTFMSEYAGKIIKRELNGKVGLSFPQEPHRVSKLNLDNAEEFQNIGFEKLISQIDKIYNEEGLNKKKKRNAIDVILNISGGYKALIPFLTIYAQLRKLPIKYIYENSNEVISIGKTPLEFDWEIIEQNYLAFEKFGQGNSSPKKSIFLDRLAEKPQKAKELFKELVEQGLVAEKKGCISLTSFGKMYYKEYAANYNSASFHRNSLHSKLIEYMVYEFYQKHSQYDTIICGYTPPSTDYDIDVYLEDCKNVIAIEVKPGGNIPIELKGKKGDHDTIEYKLTNGSFKHIIEKNIKNKNVFLRYICYSYTDLHYSIIPKIEKVLADLPKWQSVENNIVFQLCLLRVPHNFKANTNWSIATGSKSEITTIFEKSLK